jgi:hypothetical protein
VEGRALIDENANAFYRSTSWRGFTFRLHSAGASGGNVFALRLICSLAHLARRESAHAMHNVIGKMQHVRARCVFAISAKVPSEKQRVPTYSC